MTIHRMARGAVGARGAAPGGGAAPRRRLLRSLPGALALGVAAPGLGLAPSPVRAALFGPDVRELEVGSSSSGVLEPTTSRRLNVQTRLVGIKSTRWVDRDGRVVPHMGSLTQHLYENKYDWQTTLQRATDVWQLTAEDLKKPELMVLRVRGSGARPVVSLFIGIDSPRSLDPERGVEVPPSEDSSTECLGIFLFDPAARHFLTVQSPEPARLAYRVAVLPAGRFRR